jgi:hypothetical protein
MRRNRCAINRACWHTSTVRKRSDGYTHRRDPHPPGKRASWRARTSSSERSGSGCSRWLIRGSEWSLPARR